MQEFTNVGIYTVFRIRTTMLCLTKNFIHQQLGRWISISFALTMKFNLMYVQINF